ncbi:hypothetical protein BJY52DRAFT_1222140 [Lactarius psammicola]|nr:hypothetical protein BJY52DRAFT_1222140 [Lactarius psammicola]
MSPTLSFTSTRFPTTELDQSAAAENSNLPVIHPASTGPTATHRIQAPSPPALTPARKKLRHYIAVFPSSLARFPMRVSRALGDTTCSTPFLADRTKNKNPAPTTTPFLRILRACSKPEGWVEAPQVAADAEGSHTIYAINREMLVKPSGPITDYVACLRTHTALTLLLFHPPHGRFPEPVPACLTRRWLDRTKQGLGRGRPEPEEDGLGCGDFRADYGLIPACTARSHSRTCGPNGTRMHMTTVNHGNPSTWREVLDWPLRSLDGHEVVFGRGLLVHWGVGTTPKAGADSLAGAENAEDQGLTGTEETKTGNTKAPSPRGNGNTLFTAATNLNAHLAAQYPHHK